MECGGDWKHLAPLRCVRMNDEMGVHSCGLDGEVWEGETLFTAITLLSGRRRSPRLLVFASAGLIFVFLSTSVWLAPPHSSIASLFFFSPSGCCFHIFFFCFFINSLCVDVSPAVLSLWCLLIILPWSYFKRCDGELKNR